MVKRNWHNPQYCVIEIMPNGSKVRRITGVYDTCFQTWLQMHNAECNVFIELYEPQGEPDYFGPEF